MNTKLSKLYLCEKPSQARVLAKQLGATVMEDGVFTGNDVAVISAHGHLMNLAMPDEYLGVGGKWSLDSLPILPQQWIWRVNEKHAEQFDKIGLWLRRANSVVIATDPDAEGEVIGRQILYSHGYTGPISRLWFSALDSHSLNKALSNLLPLSSTDALYHAGRVRRELDWLYGMNLSRAYSVILERTTSIGRVKTRLLNDLVTRERELAQFSSEKYNVAHASFADAHLEWSPTDPASRHDNVPNFSKIGYCVSAETIEVEEQPPLPFTLSALLAQASDTGIDLASGYAAAQLLYEAEAISYPRTSSTSLPSANAIGFAVHHAIVNTLNACPSYMTDDAKAIFEMVRMNGVMQKMGAAMVNVRRLTFEFDGETFTSTDRWVEPGNAAWLNCMPERINPLISNRKTKIFKVNDRVEAVIQQGSKSTEPPPRFTEASMLRHMESLGIGTEATRVDAINGMAKERVAASVEQAHQSKVLSPTMTGIKLIASLPSAVTGSNMEDQVQKALRSVRGGRFEFSNHLLDATKWLARVIHSA